MRIIPKGWVRQHVASSLALYLILVAALLFILLYNLGSQPHGLSPSEVSVRTGSRSLTAILNNPVNGAHKLLIYSFAKAGFTGNLALRLSSVIFGIVFIISFYQLTKNWFGRLVGLFGTLILATTPLFLLPARDASAWIMLYSVTVIMAIYVWLLKAKTNKDLAFIVLLATAAIFIYTPGLLWWELGCLIICRKKIRESIELVSKPAFVVGILLAALLITPLGLALAKDWTIIKALALIPSHYPSPINIVKNLGWMISSLFVKAPRHSELFLGRLPILNIIQITLMVFGSCALWMAAKTKSIALLASITLAVLLAGLNNNPVLLALGLPAICLFVSAGLRYLYIEWRGIFPRNPVAKALALLLMGAVVAVHLLFGLRYALIAWPQTVATKAIYVLK